MRAVVNPALPWNEYQQLWLRLIAPAKPSQWALGPSAPWLSWHLHSHRAVSSAMMLCCEYTSYGLYAQKSCKYWHECPMCRGHHLFSACSRREQKGKTRQPTGRTNIHDAGKGPSTTRMNLLRNLLHSYPRIVDGSYLLAGFTHRFRIPFQGPKAPCMSANLHLVIGM